jgi:hypothetical protein
LARIILAWLSVGVKIITKGDKIDAMPKDPKYTLFTFGF